MATLFRLLMYVFLGVLAIAGAGAGLAYYLASHSLPVYDDRHAARGLDAPLEIVRDNYAVPHIFGESDHDVLFGLGYAHAQDRLWQMLMFRRTAQGRLSELFGEDTLRADELMRALDLYGLSIRAAELQTTAVRAELQAYSNGVNALIDRVRQEARGRGAPEMLLFSPQVAPWTPADSIAVMKLMALQLTDKAVREVLRARLSLRLDEARIADILPDPPGAVMALPEYADMVPGAAGLKLAAMAPPPPGSPLPELNLAGASNAWAASAERAAAGAPLLATDPHLALIAPSYWYLARLEFENGGAIGGTIPGIPGILVGRNTHIAWGITSAYLDDQDIYIEKLDSENPNRYLTPQGPESFAVRNSIVDIAGQAPVTLRLTSTRHGPVIPSPHFGVDAVTPEGHVASLAWTGLSAADRGLETLLGIMRAETVAEARTFGRYFVAPSLNLVLAGPDGIALQTIGRAPLRRATHQGLGRLPVAGWVDGNDWVGSLPYEENPAVADPDGGIVVNTNNRISDGEFPHHWSFDWGDSQRIARATKLLNGREFHTLGSFIEIQTDTVSEAARTLLPLIGRDLWYTGAPSPDAPDRLRRDALERMAGWNGEMSEHAAEPLIYAAWVRALQRRLIVDELGEVAGDLQRPEPLFIERVFRDVDGASVWCDVVQSTPVETCPEMARLALDDALLELSDSYGERIESWRWGDAHQAVHRHQVMDRVPMAGWLFNITQSTPGGDNTLLRGQSTARGEYPYRNTHGAGFRGVFDLSDPDSSVFIISTGESGHFLSRHYDDQSVLWRRSEYLPMSLDRVAARGGAVGITRLTPR